MQVLEIRDRGNQSKAADNLCPLHDIDRRPPGLVAGGVARVDGEAVLPGDLSRGPVCSIRPHRTHLVTASLPLIDVPAHTRCSGKGELLCLTGFHDCEGREDPHARQLGRRIE
jgi:hypothetical protein